jgi:hypothetical protein
MKKPQEFNHAIQAVAARFAPNVVEVRVTLDEDWSGDPCARIMMIVSDSLKGAREIRQATRVLEEAIEKEVDPDEEWGVYPYFNVRTALEQVQLDRLTAA